MGTSKPNIDYARFIQTEQDGEDIHALLTRLGPKAFLTLISEQCALEADNIEREQPYSSVAKDYWMMEGYRRAAVLTQEASERLEF